MASRRGSFLVICIVMVALMVLVGAALLRHIVTQNDASTANQRVLLAQAAAKAGMAHALEQVLRDHVATTTVTRTDAGGAATTVALPARTTLDGDWRTPFLAHDLPDRPDYDQNRPDADKDVRLEQHLMRPYVWSTWDDFQWSPQGMTHAVGRGRWYEPNWYSVTPTPGTDEPVAPVSFVDLAAPAPERAEGIFYDEQFRRVEAADPVEARAAARYRLRYAVNVEDLSGHLLSNPQADMRLPDDYRTPPNWVARSADAFAAMMTAGSGWEDNSPVYAARYEHVFLGRGFGGNVDRDANGFPSTFPRMYRWAHGTHEDLDPDIFQSWHGNRQVAVHLHKTAFVPGSKDGGESPWKKGGGGQPYWHALVGPQQSWWNHHTAVYQAFRESWNVGYSRNASLFATTPFGRALTQPPGYPASYHPSRRRWYEGRVNTPFHVNLLTAPPWIVNAMMTTYLPPKFKIYKYTYISWFRYLGKNADGHDIWDWDHPEGTAIDGYNPQNNSAQYGRDLLVDTTSPAFGEFPAPQRDGTTSPAVHVAGEIVKPDYYVSDYRFGTHQRRNLDGTESGQTVAPYLDVYPGPAWNGDPDQAGQGTDDCGKDITSDQLGYGVCFRTYAPWLRLDPSPPWYERSNFGTADGAPAAEWEAGALTVDPPAWWKANPRNRAYKSPDPRRLKYQDSYWWDIYGAMAMAMSVVRAQWMQYDNWWPDGWHPRWNPTFKVAECFPAGEHDPARYATLRDVDRAFLAELGESLDAPGTGTPAELEAAGRLRAYRLNWRHDGLNVPYFLRWLPANNIRSAKAALAVGSPPTSGMTADERAASMERVLNDFRLAFLGSSPEYSDGIDPVTRAPTPADEFRPLDFDGDGRVHCSCYQAATGAPVAEPHAPAGADGRGPKPAPEMYFSPTGNFFMGKSHFFRVMARGEVWDNRLNSVVTDATLESAIAVDPEGTDPLATQTLYQRWHFDRYQGMMSHIKP